jgi:hypothetical protein
MSAKNDQIIYDVAIAEGFTPTAAKFVVAQARFESANYSSNVFNTNNNTSGMKYIGQPLATRGTLAPPAERTSTCRNGGKCVNSDYYAKFESVADSANDVISRLYNITKGGITPQQLKNAKTPEEFAQLLKARGYYGESKGQSPAQSVNEYAAGIRSLLRRIQVVEFIDKNKYMLLMGAALIGISLGYYIYYKKS